MFNGKIFAIEGSDRQEIESGFIDIRVQVDNIKEWAKYLGEEIGLNILEITLKLK